VLKYSQWDPPEADIYVDMDTDNRKQLSPFSEKWQQARP